jgi:hypothetical protein
MNRYEKEFDAVQDVFELQVCTVSCLWWFEDCVEVWKNFD